jgi:16S rRNA (guanine527-N7)-methyltransferase
VNEEAARAWIRARFGVSRETGLAAFLDLLIAENTHQNLIAPSTVATAWSRHILDSAQLVPLAADRHGTWIDIGSGAGLPGIVVAILRDQPVLLVEPRRRRAEFLADTARALGLDQVEVSQRRIAQVAHPPAAVISARAVAGLPELLRDAVHLSTAATLWLLPKGRSAQSEVAAARQTWQGRFHVEPSLTEPDSRIVVATEISARCS